MRCVLVGVGDPGLPEAVAVATIEAQERSAVFLFDCLRHEHMMSPHNRRRVPWLWQCHAPQHVLGRAPFLNSVFL